MFTFVLTTRQHNAAAEQKPNKSATFGIANNFYMQSIIIIVMKARLGVFVARLQVINQSSPQISGINHEQHSLPHYLDLMLARRSCIQKSQRGRQA